MRVIFIVIAVIISVYFFMNNDTTNIINNNYGQFDKGTPQCDKGAYGDINGLCK